MQMQVMVRQKKIYLLLLYFSSPLWSLISVTTPNTKPEISNLPTQPKQVMETLPHKKEYQKCMLFAKCWYLKQTMVHVKLALRILNNKKK